MGKVIVWCLMVVLCAGEAQAQLLGREAGCGLSSDELLEMRKGRYFSAQSYSRFPRSEKKLRLYPDYRRDPLSLIYSRAQLLRYTVQPGDTLWKIARRKGTTVEFIREINGLKGSRIRDGKRLLLWSQPFRIEINKTLNRLSLKLGDVLLKEYPVSTGKSDAQTPRGIFFIRSRYPYPTWFHKGKVIPGGAPDNLLGTRWLGFDKPQFGIHGTIYPELIGQSVSKGCIRMRNEDVEELYEFIPLGTAVVITE